MRELIDLLESFLTEKSRGLLYRAKGDRFFKGGRANPEQAIIFDKVDYFPSQPGKYETPEETSAAYQDAEKRYPGLIPTNTPTKASKAFAIITLHDESTNQPIYYARFFSEIKPNMAGAWSNKDLPGFQLEKATSLKASYGLQPSELFAPPARFKNIQQLLQAFKANPKVQPFVPGFEMLYMRKPEFPIFENAGEFFTAIRDDLGETIGPVALIQGLDMGTGAQAAQHDLLEGGDWSGSSIKFPLGKTNTLVDCYIVTSNGVEVGISSKGEKGATASVKSVNDGINFIKSKGSPEQKKILDKYAKQVSMIADISKSSIIDFPLRYAVDHGFITPELGEIIPQMINLGAKRVTDIKMSKDVANEIDYFASMRRGDVALSNYNLGYNVLASIAQVVADDINRDPKFGKACLKFLNSSPVIQLHASAAKKADNSVAITGFISKYPPNFNGTVELESGKTYTSTAADGRMTFSYNGSDAGTGNKEATPSSPIKPGKSLSVAAKDIVNPTYKPKEVGGRKKRK